MTGRRLLRVLIVLGILVVILVAADRITSVFAGKQAANYLDKRADFTSKPTVDIHGFPFITQAIEGRYSDVEVRSGGVKVGKVQASSLDVHLRGAHLPLSAVFGASISQLPVDNLTGTVTFSYAELVKLSDIAGLSLSEQGDALAVSARLAVPDTNTTAQVSGTAKISVVGGALRLAVSNISVAGISLPASVLSGFATTLATPIPIPALPFGLRITAVTVTSAGVVVAGAASQLVIRSTG
jgi:hypothetical protein